MLPTEDMRVKYHSRNPVVRWMVRGFLQSFDSFFSPLPVKRVLEVGCGEGYLSRRMQSLHPGIFVCGLDDSEAILDRAQKGGDEVPFLRGSVYQLPCRDREFDLIVACEVLEHLTDPEKALEEIRRGTRGYVLLSVPQEPVWRAMNMMRGKYWSSWGNYHGHIQHWSPRRFVRLVRNYFCA
ncbi:MAG: class I SAM-dependent methyltransferase [Nitrospirae bacterium]|nr:class I SAM-dependent methyltransferase [Nitrospirota bacterium]